VKEKSKTIKFPVGFELAFYCIWCKHSTTAAQQQGTQLSETVVYTGICTWPGHVQ